MCRAFIKNLRSGKAQSTAVRHFPDSIIISQDKPGIKKQLPLLRQNAHNGIIKACNTVRSKRGITVKRYQDINAETIDRWIDEGWEWGVPIDTETFRRAKNGDWDVVLTPTKPVPHAWFGELCGKKLLGLASGGGQQMPVFAALGADCTVLDYSEKQLESERLVAEREGYGIRIVRADMTQPLPFRDGEFDIIFHPVSNCYIRDVRHVWRECFRVLKPGGVLLSGTDHYVNYLVDEAEERIINRLPFDPLANPDQMEQLSATDSGVQFSHTIEEQIGGQLEAGFILTDIYEDTNGSGRLHDMNIPTFLAMRSVKPLK
ncbi:MAG: class I SAM-dependent methyltransferase [Clostridia bacterium]|nr:class I SAM-dependent methyltransferase [Clostridia bacterium]